MLRRGLSKRSIAPCNSVPRQMMWRCTAQYGLQSAMSCNGYRHSFLGRSEEHTSELQSLMRISYAVFCLKKKTKSNNKTDSLTRSSINEPEKRSHKTIVEC